MGDDASFRLALARPGSWTLRVEAPGFGTGERSVVVRDGEVVEVSLDVTPDPLALDGVDVAVDRRCPERSGRPAVARSWLEARRVLASVVDGTREGRARFRLEVAESRRALAEAGWSARPVVESVDTVLVEGAFPLRSPDPRELLGRGFIVPLFPDNPDLYEYDVYAPGPEVVLSDPFLSTHCFFIREAPDREAWVGLGFEPDRSSRLAYDVEGTFWLPRETTVTPVIEFTHTRYPHEDELWFHGGPEQRIDWAFETALRGRTGGRMEMSFVPELGWIVHRFELRTPDVRRDRQLVADPRYRDRMRRGEDPRDMPGCCRAKLRTIWRLAWIRSYSVRVIEVMLDEGAGGR